MHKNPICGLLLAVAALLLPAIGQAAQPLRIGTNVWPGYEPLYLAAEHEDWRSKLNIRMVEYPSATEVIRAFRNRALEGAALTLDEVLTLREANIPLKVIAVLDISSGGDVILAKADIAHFSELAGRRIGVESNALGAYMLTRALELHDMTLDQLEVVPLGVSAHEAAFRRETVDAVVTFEPVRTRLLDAGAHEVFSSREIPGEVVDVLVVHADTLRTERPRLRELLEGWFRALGHLQSDPLAAARFTAQRLRITPEQVVASYAGLELPDPAQNLALLNGLLRETLSRLQQTLIRERLLASTIATDGLLYGGLIPR
jgi:NitT/TauT family transport system substrate-binding protein